MSRPKSSTNTLWRLYGDFLLRWLQTLLKQELLGANNFFTLERRNRSRALPMNAGLTGASVPFGGYCPGQPGVGYSTGRYPSGGGGGGSSGPSYPANARYSSSYGETTARSVPKKIKISSHKPRTSAGRRSSNNRPQRLGKEELISTTVDKRPGAEIEISHRQAARREQEAIEESRKAEKKTRRRSLRARISRLRQKIKPKRLFSFFSREQGSIPKS